MRGRRGPIVQIQVTFRPRRRPPESVVVPAGARVGDLVKAVGMSADEALVVRGDAVITESEALHDGESITVMSAFSGG